MTTINAVENSTGQKLLAEHLLAESQWRQEIAEQFPDDFRNERSAQSLADLASFVTRMPADHIIFQAVSAVEVIDVLMLEPEASAMAARYGFTDHVFEPTESEMEEFLVDLVQTHIGESLTSFELCASGSDVDDQVETLEEWGARLALFVADAQQHDPRLAH